MSYREVLDRMEGAASRAGRSVDEITLVVVSKDRSPEEILRVYNQGHRDFGENRAQELSAKAAPLPKDIRWHFVGGLQSNKVRLVRPLVSLLHSLDRTSLALAWLKGPGLPPPVLVQVNVGGEDQKSGVASPDVTDTVAMAVDLGLEVRGLMTVPPVPETPEASRGHFRELARIAAEVAVRWPQAMELSMGMTDDFEVAIEEGSTMIRVGRAIFGAHK